MIDENCIGVGISDIKIGKDPQLLTTNLGSCIGVCLYSQSQRVGGMLHLMMAESGPAKEKDDFKAAKYADTGIPKLLDDLKARYNVEAKDLKAKIFGGAKILAQVSNNIGAENERAVREILKALHIPIIAAKTGGDKGYKITLHLSSGKVSCRIFGNEEEEF